MIVNALGVAFVIALRHEGGHVVVGAGLQHLPREVFGAIDLLIFRNDSLIPNRALRFEFGIYDLFEKARAGEVIGESAVARQQRELQRLLVHAELMLAKLDEIAASDEDFRFVADLLQRVLLHRLEPRLQLIRTHAVTELAQFVDEIAQLRDHRIRGEPGMHLFRFGKIR